MSKNHLNDRESKRAQARRERDLDARPRGDGNDFVPVVPSSTSRAARYPLHLFRTRDAPVSINNGYVMRAWYDVKWAISKAKRRSGREGVRPRRRRSAS